MGLGELIKAFLYWVGDIPGGIYWFVKEPGLRLPVILMVVTIIIVVYLLMRWKNS